MLSEIVQHNSKFILGNIRKKSWCFQNVQKEQIKSAQQPLPRLLFLLFSDISSPPSHSSPKTPSSFQCFALSRERRVVKLSSLLPKWVSVYLQLAGAGFSPKYAEHSPMSAFAGQIMASLLSAEEIHTAFPSVLCSWAWGQNACPSIKLLNGLHSFVMRKFSVSVIKFDAKRWKWW